MEDEDDFDCGEVLEAGLPPLPAPVPPEEFCVPVARWVGPRFGAVRFLEGYPDEDGYRVDDDVALLRRTPGGWVEADGGGGTNWYFDDAPLLRRPACAPQHAEVSEELWVDSEGWSCVAVSGVAGVDARWVEVEQDDQTTRQALESPLGLFVACADATDTAIVRVLDRDEKVLTRYVLAREPWRQ